MEEVHAQFKKWIELVKVDRIEGIAKELKETVTWKPDTRLNRTIFKMLLHLSHTAERCDNSQILIAREMYNLTDAICSILVEIPDLRKYFLSLFHVARRLMSFHLYAEAIAVCDRLFPAQLLNETPLETPDMYIKMADLWHSSANNFLKIPPDEFNKNNYDCLVRIIEYELEILKLVSETHTKHVLIRVHFYITKIGPLTRSLKGNYDEHFRNVIAKNLSQLKLSVKNHRKFNTYYDILVLMNSVVVDKILNTQMDLAANAFAQFSRIFESSVRKEPESSQCFTLYKKLCRMLLKPVETLPSNFHAQVQDYVQELSETIEKFGEFNAVRCNTLIISHVLDLLYSYWENRLKAGEHSAFTPNVLHGIILLVQSISSLLSVQKAETNKICRAEDCQIKTDLYNATVIRMRCVGIFSRVPLNTSLQEILPQATELLESSVASISEMKESGCKAWSILWSSCGLHIYNLAISCYAVFCDQSAMLFSLLCSCIVRFEGVSSKSSHLSLERPMSCALHRLSGVYYSQGKYREAMTASAFNGLLSYREPNSSAFRMWGSIKHKNAAESSVMKMSMLECLRTDREAIYETGVDIDLIEFEPRELCLRELKGLQQTRCDMSVAMQATLRELEGLKATASQYAQGVQLVGYHLLNFTCNEEFPRLLRKATTKLRKERDHSMAARCLRANMSFYAFVVHLQTIERNTAEEMESAKFPLRASKLSGGGAQEMDSVVPAYSMINIEEDSNLFRYLQEALKEWSFCIDSNITALVNGWEPKLTLHALMITGEYCRLHEFLTCEIHAWTLAYKLAYELEDYRACIHVVGRSISLRQINERWIEAANGFVEKLKNSDDSETIETIAMFWISLSDFYFETGKYTQATKLFEKAINLPGIRPHQNLATYLLSVDTTLHNCNLQLNGSQDERYTVNIVKCLYSILSLKEHLQIPKWGFKEKQLYSYDVLLTCTTHLSLRMNSLLSFKEISSHLVHRLKMAQKLGLTLRVAECLKSLCFIDLSRLQLEDCEVKLQGLEHILGIETFEQSRNTKLETVSNLLLPVTSRTHAVDPIRDIQQNDTSPILRKKVFVEPDFLKHKDCGCYKCNNLSYQYLVAASTHIRAQLYALQDHRKKALQHFRGCFRMQQKLLRMQCNLELREIPEKERNLISQHAWRQYYNTVDYVLFLLDFSRFIRGLKLPNREELNIALEALEICKVYNLQSHPIHIAVNELIFEYRFQDLVENSCSFEKFTVPDARSINIDKFVHENKTVDLSLCITPTSGPRHKKPITVRRHKTPPLLKLKKISMDLSDDEEIAPTHKVTTPKITRISRPLRRKISVEEYTEASPIANENKLNSTIMLSTETLADEEKNTLRQIIDQAVLVVPDLSQSLRKIGKGDELEKPASSETIGKVVKIMEDFRISREKNVRKSQRITRAQVKTQKKKAEVESSLASDSDKEKIDEVIDMFKGMLIANTPSKLSSDRISDWNVDPQTCSTPFRKNSTKLQQSDASLEHRQGTSVTGDINDKVSPELEMCFQYTTKPVKRSYSKRMKPAKVSTSVNRLEKQNTSKSAEPSEAYPTQEFNSDIPTNIKSNKETTKAKKHDIPVIKIEDDHIVQEIHKSYSAKNRRPKKTTKDNVSNN